MEMPRSLRLCRKIRATCEQTVWRVKSDSTAYHYQNRYLTAYITIVISRHAVTLT
jgi:hypothetical protein